MVFGNPVNIYQSGTTEYEEVMGRKETGLHYSIYFNLAEWTDRGVEINMDDGFGNYRIRTQSFNSVRNLVNEYRRIREIWRGPFRGVPFELTLPNRQGNAPDGKKRSYPVFAFTLKPRGGLRLTSGNFHQLVLSGNKAAEGLSLPAPRDPTPEDDQKDAIFADLYASGGNLETAAAVTPTGGGGSYCQNDCRQALHHRARPVREKRRGRGRRVQRHSCRRTQKPRAQQRP